MTCARFQGSETLSSQISDPHLMKINASVLWSGSLFPSTTGLSEMNLRKLSPLILRICVALIAFAVLFSAPASHAAHQSCSNVASNSVWQSHNDDHHSKAKAALGDQACCSSICAVCLLIIPSPTASSSVSFLLAQTSDLQAPLVGRAPSPGLKPPQSAV